MRRPLALRLPLLLSAAALWGAAGCDSHPTYPKARVAEALQDILQEARFTSSVRLIDHTLALQLQHPGALMQHEGEIGLGPAFDEILRKSLMATHRVLLSSDAEVRFYVLLISDPQTPGAYLTLIRYMDDIRRANANMLDTSEIFARTILELDVGKSAPPTLEQYVPREIRMEEFLTWQLARRIQSALVNELQERGVANVGRCGGQFENGEFAFTLNVSPVASDGFDETTMRDVFQTSVNVIAKVLSSYQFESFNTIRLIHPLTGRSLLLPKGRLDPFK